MANTKLTERSLEALNYIKANGGKVSTAELASALDRTVKSVVPTITDLTKKGLAVRESVAGATPEDKPVVYAVLTEEGKNFVQPEDAE
jgi:DNA-binding MarR family transcriptional regulator